MTEHKPPKMVKYSDDECYGMKFKESDHCTECWIMQSCESSHKAYIKKKKNSKTRPKPKEKKFKKTDKHRDWI